MLEKLQNLVVNSYSPYSNYKTSSIVVVSDGREFEGVNVENKSFKNGLCAEQVAISAAVAEGYKKGDFKELHVYGDGEKFSYPCFLCRQILLEFYDLDGIVHVYKKNGEEETLLVKDLCPYPFEFEGEKNV